MQSINLATLHYWSDVEDSLITKVYKEKLLNENLIIWDRLSGVQLQN